MIMISRTATLHIWSDDYLLLKLISDPIRYWRNDLGLAQWKKPRRAGPESDELRENRPKLLDLLPLTVRSTREKRERKMLENVWRGICGARLNLLEDAGIDDDAQINDHYNAITIFSENSQFYAMLKLDNSQEKFLWLTHDVRALYISFSLTAYFFSSCIQGFVIISIYVWVQEPGFCTILNS